MQQGVVAAGVNLEESSRKGAGGPARGSVEKSIGRFHQGGGWLLSQSIVRKTVENGHYSCRSHFVDATEVIRASQEAGAIEVAVARLNESLGILALIQGERVQQGERAGEADLESNSTTLVAAGKISSRRRGAVKIPVSAEYQSVGSRS